ncbi:hypothetical protein ACJX0J_036560 [Zea mays]
MSKFQLIPKYTLSKGHLGIILEAPAIEILRLIYFNNFPHGLSYETVYNLIFLNYIKIGTEGQPVPCSAGIPLPFSFFFMFEVEHPSHASWAWARKEGQMAATWKIPLLSLTEMIGLQVALQQNKAAMLPRTIQICCTAVILVFYNIDNINLQPEKWAQNQLSNTVSFDWGEGGSLSIENRKTENKKKLKYPSQQQNWGPAYSTADIANSDL